MIPLTLWWNLQNCSSLHYLIFLNKFDPNEFYCSPFLISEITSIILVYMTNPHFFSLFFSSSQFCYTAVILLSSKFLHFLASATLSMCNFIVILKWTLSSSGKALTQLVRGTGIDTCIICCYLTLKLAQLWAKMPLSWV